MRQLLFAIFAASPLLSCGGVVFAEDHTARATLALTEALQQSRKSDWLGKAMLSDLLKQSECDVLAGRLKKLVTTHKRCLSNNASQPENCKEHILTIREQLTTTGKRQQNGEAIPMPFVWQIPLTSHSVTTEGILSGESASIFVGKISDVKWASLNPLPQEWRHLWEVMSLDDTFPPAAISATALSDALRLSTSNRAIACIAQEQDLDFRMSVDVRMASKTPADEKERSRFLEMILTLNQLDFVDHPHEYWISAGYILAKAFAQPERALAALLWLRREFSDGIENAGSAIDWRAFAASMMLLRETTVGGLRL